MRNIETNLEFIIIIIEGLPETQQKKRERENRQMIIKVIIIIIISPI